MKTLMDSRLASGVLLLCVGVALAGSSAWGTTLRRIELPEMVRTADRVVHARAISVNVRWDADRRRILTDTTFEVIEAAKGAGPARLTVTMLGGRIDPIEMTVEGAPAFEVGKEVVLMTSPRPDGKKNIVGFSQGVFRIQEDPKTGARYVAGEAPAGTTFVESAGGPRVGPQGGPATRLSRVVLPLEVFMENVRALASRGVPKPDAAGRRMRLEPVGRPGVKP